MTDGLASDAVTEVLQDSKGFLWIGTSGGLSRYDGYSFTNYDRKHGLPTSDITCLLESRKNPGCLWLGTSGGGLAILDGERFRSVKIDAPGNTNIVSSLTEDPSGNLWVATFGGLFRYDTTIHPVFLTPRMHTGSYIGLIDSTRLSFAYADSLVLLTFGEQIESTISLRGHSRGFITCQQVLSDGSIIIATSDSVILRFDRSLRLLEKARHNSSPIGTTYQDKNGLIWLGTRQGLYAVKSNMLNNGSLVRHGKGSGLPSEWISSMLTDSEGNFWIGSIGLLKLGRSRLWKFPLPGISSAYDNRRAVVDSAGHFWVGTSEGLVEIWRTEGDAWRQHNHHTPRVPNAVLFYDSYHRLWAKPPGKGLMYFDIVRKKDSRSHLVERGVKWASENFAEQEWSTFLVTTDNHLWASIGAVGVVHCDLNTGEVLHLYGKEDGVPDLSVRVLYEDRDRNIWIGGFLEGIAVALSAQRYHPPLKKITMADGLPDNWIRAMTQDRHGRIWIGTRRAGIAVQMGDSMKSISTLDGLADDAVWGLVEAGDEIWAATHKGFQRIRSGSFEPVSLQKEFIVSGVGACGTDGTGTLWFATLDAFYLYDYVHDIRESGRPPVHITSVEVNGLPKQVAANIAVSYSENNWTVTFVGLSFRHEGDLHYQYRLLGADDHWSPPANTRSVSFSSLSPGEYEFQVEAVTPDGIRSSLPARLAFRIASPFWVTWWFRGFVLACVIGGVGLAYRASVVKLHREELVQRKFSQELLTSQERERSRIAGELHDSLVQDLLVAKNRSLIGLQKCSDATATERELREISETLSRAIEEVREVAHNLRPYQLDRLGLTRAIRSLVSVVGTSSSIKFSFESQDIDQHCGGERSILLYRILQEATNNIVRHSGASVAAISIRRHQSGIDITIRDNGNGFLTDGTTNFGFGLTGITQRVRMMNGTISVDSSPGFGTTLHIVIPIDEESV
jgi:signal transduction histidine kinase/ligand-binding sensor domain-containing protein